MKKANKIPEKRGLKAELEKNIKAGLDYVFKKTDPYNMSGARPVKILEPQLKKAVKQGLIDAGIN